MVAEKGIKITTAPDGKVTIEAVGFTGKACSMDVGALQEIVGLAGGDEQLKEEYFLGEENIHLSQNG